MSDATENPIFTKKKLFMEQEVLVLSLVCGICKILFWQLFKSCVVPAAEWQSIVTHKYVIHTIYVSKLTCSSHWQIDDDKQSVPELKRNTTFPMPDNGCKYQVTACAYSNRRFLLQFSAVALATVPCVVRACGWTRSLVFVTWKMSLISTHTHTDNPPPIILYSHTDMKCNEQERLWDWWNMWGGTATNIQIILRKMIEKWNGW